jgi:general secretion pathway protein M
MLKFDRAHVISIAALAAVLLSCILAVGVSIGVRAAALQELEERQQTLSRLQTQAATRPEGANRLIAGRAPAAAFLEAQTAGLASAELQTYIARLAAAQQATLTSSAVEQAGRVDSADTIRVQVTLESNLSSLQAMLYRLESATPYVFVETLSLQSVNATERGVENPNLRLTLGVRALWRRGQT